MIDVYVIFIILAAISYYSIAKERHELGCYRVLIGRQCKDENSIYVKNTKMNNADSCGDLISRMKSIISYHEKGGVWRRCFVISVMIVIFVHIVNMNSKFKNTYHYVVILLLTFTLLYFYHNYLNYHHFRNLKQNGVEILEKMQQMCFKN